MVDGFCSGWFSCPSTLGHTGDFCQRAENKQPRFKLVIVGDETCGKTNNTKTTPLHYAAQDGDWMNVIIHEHQIYQSLCLPPIHTA